MKTFNRILPVNYFFPSLKNLMLLLILLTSFSYSNCQIIVDYLDHCFDSSGNLIVEINFDYQNAICTGTQASCEFPYSADIKVKQGSVDVITPYSISNQISINSGANGITSVESFVVPASYFSGLVSGQSYDLVIELLSAGIDIVQAIDYHIMAPCFTGSVDGSSFALCISDCPCEKTVASFTYEAPLSTFSWQQGTTTLCSKKPFFHCWIEPTLHVSFNGPGVASPGATYTWYVDGVQVGTGQNFTYNFPNCGTYEVKLRIDWLGASCPVEFLEVIDIVAPRFCQENDTDPSPNRLGVFQMDEILVSVTPNPAKFQGTILIEYFQATPGQTKIELYDLRGNLINAVVNEQKEIGQHIYKMQLAELPAGFYQIRLKNGDATGFTKLLIN